jgi:plastocyanin
VAPVRPRVFVAAIAAALVLTACGGGGVETGKVAGKAGGAPTANARTVDIEASNFHFAPGRIEIGTGKEIALTLTSEDGPHDFAVDGLGLVADVSGGGTTTHRLRIDTPGTYTFFCTIPGHRDGGMEGSLVVK